MEPVQPVLINIYQGNTYRKDLSWLHFNHESRVQERQKVKDQLSYISVVVGYLKFQVATRSTSLDMTTVCHAIPYGRFIEIQSNPRRKKRHRTNQGSDFLGSSFSNTDNVWAPTQFWRERQPQHLKQWFFLNNRSIHCHINSTTVITLVNWNQMSFSSIEINKLLPVPVHSLSWIRFKFRSQL